MRVGVSKLETSLLTHFLCQISTLFFSVQLAVDSILDQEDGKYEHTAGFGLIQ